MYFPKFKLRHILDIFKKKWNLIRSIEKCLRILSFLVKYRLFVSFCFSTRHLSKQKLTLGQFCLHDVKFECFECCPQHDKLALLFIKTILQMLINSTFI